MSTHSYEKTITVRAPIAEAFRALTNATVLRQWFCDFASYVPRPEGRIYFAWQSGYYACGEVLDIKEPEMVRFSWRGRGEPTATTVSLHLTQEGDATRISLTHEGWDDSDAWRPLIESIRHGWEKGFENLVSVLQTGEDLRITTRPLLGITVGTLNDETIQKLGVPVTSGLLLNSILDGMGAQKAGLLKNDVVISVDGSPSPTFNAILPVLQKHRAGDVVPVEFYRGPDKKSVQMAFSKRPLPEIPTSAQQIAENYSRSMESPLGSVEDLLTSLADGDFSFRPAEGEWTIQEILAHLIQVERSTHDWIQQMVFDQEAVSDDYGDNLDARVRATVSVYPGARDLLAEFKRSVRETAAVLRELPAEFSAHRGSLWQIAYRVYFNPNHVEEHIKQMKACIEAAGEKGTAIKA